MGISVSISSLGPWLQSCQETERLAWEPQFFTAEDAKTVTAIVDIMLPRTDTTGAIDLKVDLFVYLMFKKALSPEDQQHVRAGVGRFSTICQDMFSEVFTKLSRDQQDQVLAQVGADTNKFNPSIWGSTLGVQAPIDFYRRVRQFALLGYYTSQEIIKV